MSTIPSNPSSGGNYYRDEAGVLHPADAHGNPLPPEAPEPAADPVPAAVTTETADAAPANRYTSKKD